MSLMSISRVKDLQGAEKIVCFVHRFQTEYTPDSEGTNTGDRKQNRQASRRKGRPDRMIRLNRRSRRTQCYDRINRISQDFILALSATSACSCDRRGLCFDANCANRSKPEMICLNRRPQRSQRIGWSVDLDFCLSCLLPGSFSGDTKIPELDRGFHGLR